MNTKALTFLSINLIGLLLGQFIPFAQQFGIGPFMFLTAIFLEYFRPIHYLFYIVVQVLVLIPSLPGLQIWMNDFILQFVKTVNLLPTNKLTEPVVFPFTVNQLLLILIPVALGFQLLTLYGVHRAFHKIKLFERLSQLHSGA